MGAANARIRSREAARLSDLIEDMDQAGVRTSLVVLHEETGEFFRLAAEHPGRLYGLAYYDSVRPREGLEQVRTLCEAYPALVLGVKTALAYFSQDPRWKELVPLYDYCVRRGLPVQFHMGRDPRVQGTSRPMGLAVLAGSYPRLKIVCLHAGGGWHREMPYVLRAFPNVYLQVEALQRHEAEADGEPRILRDLLRTAGSRKLMFGSGWLGREPGYFQRVEVVRRLPWWHRSNIGWRTAARVYGPRILGNRKLENGNRLR